MGGPAAEGMWGIGRSGPRGRCPTEIGTTLNVGSETVPGGPASIEAAAMGDGAVERMLGGEGSQGRQGSGAVREGDVAS